MCSGHLGAGDQTSRPTPSGPSLVGSDEMIDPGSTVSAVTVIRAALADPRASHAERSVLTALALDADPNLEIADAPRALRLATGLEERNTRRLVAHLQEIGYL